MAGCARGLRFPCRCIRANVSTRQLERRGTMASGHGGAVAEQTNSQTYSGMMTPSAAPSRRPVPRVESVDMCDPAVQREMGRSGGVGGGSPENVKDSGRMPMPNDVRPSKLENVRRTSSVNIVVQENLKDTRAYNNRVAKRRLAFASCIA
jgi:hypothetical protein